MCGTILILNYLVVPLVFDLLSHSYTSELRYIVSWYLSFYGGIGGYAKLETNFWVQHKHMGNIASKTLMT